MTNQERSWPVSVAGICLIGALLSVPAAVGAAESGVQSEIPGLKNPEDMVRVPGTRCAIVSRLGRDPHAPGGFSLVDLEAKSSRVLIPDVSKPAVAMYSDCPKAPVASELITHGLDIRRAQNTIELFAVNHGGRESIEVFNVRLDRQGAALIWTGCVMLPADISANAVAALPAGLAVSSFGTSGDQGEAELLAGNPSGFIERWTPHRGWSHVAGTEFGGDNGLVAASDGSVLYVNDWNDGTLRVVPLGHGAPPATIGLGSFHPDNIHALPNGDLLIAGQIGSAREILACATQSSCSVGSMVVEVDRTSQSVRSRWIVPATSAFGAASTALSYGGHYWLSSFRGDRIVELTPTPGGQ
jgi:hypothetical protein